MPPRARTALLSFAFDYLLDAMSAAGSNDMDQSVFAGLPGDEMTALYLDFLKWDQSANPEEWEPREFESISDTAWAHYLKDSLALEGTKQS